MKGIQFILLYLCFSLGAHAGDISSRDREDECEKVLHWVYKELTLNNLDLSYQRVMNKFLLSLHHLQNNKVNHPQVKKIYETLVKLDPEFKKFNLTGKNFLRRLFGKKGKTLNTVSLKNVLLEWQHMQSTNPELFLGMEEQYFLDQWDIQTVTLIDQIADYPLTNSDTKMSLLKLQEKLNRTKEDFLDKRAFNIDTVKNDFQNTHKQIFKNLNDQYRNIIDNYESICSQEHMNQFILSENYVCPLPQNGLDLINISSQLQTIQDVFTSPMPIVTATASRPIDLPIVEETNTNVPIEKIQYERNDNGSSTYCKRDPNMISTIVIHHTESDKETSPHEINSWHLDRTSDGEPWYMVGYNYLISESFQGATAENLKVFEGREPYIKGAHAGGYSDPLSEEEKKYFGQYKVSCGNEFIGFKEESALSQIDEKGGISGNLISYGIAVIGNYAPESYSYWGQGLYAPENINANEDYLPSGSTIELLAKFSCNLQKKNKNIKTIVPHNFYRGTKCPGSLILYLNRIKEMASQYGCEFEVRYNKLEM